VRGAEGVVNFPLLEVGGGGWGFPWVRSMVGIFFRILNGLIFSVLEKVGSSIFCRSLEDRKKEIFTKS
jgi:hypothetical protein